MTCKWKVFCEQGDTCVAHEGYDILKCTAFKKKGAITNEVDRFNALDVLKVMKMVKKPQTNEEYIKSLNTEQLAEFIDNVLEHCADMDCGGCYMHHGGNCNYKDIVEWLNEEHKNGRN